MTGPDMDRYLKDTIQNDDITKIGTYDIDNDDVILHLCPEGCGGPVIGHIYDDNDKCSRKASPDHDDYTDEKSKTLQENIKNLHAWKKTKMLWITEKTRCKCDLCPKSFKNMFVLYDHMKNDHNMSENMIAPKLTNQKPNEVPSTSTSIEEAIRLLSINQTHLISNVNTKDLKSDPKDFKSNVHLQKPRFVPEWTKFQKYEVFRENLSNWDTEHDNLSDTNKFGQVMMSLTKNKDIPSLSKLASGKISETLLDITVKTVQNIIKLLDKKFLQTTSEKREQLAHELLQFKLSNEDTAEESWDKFCKLRSSLLKGKLIADIFLHTIFFNLCVKSQKIKLYDEHCFRDLLEDGSEDTIHENFERVFSKQKLIGRRMATKVSSTDNTETIILLGDIPKQDEEEEVHYGDQQRGRSQFRGKKRFYRSNSKPNYYKFEERSKSKFNNGRDQSPGGRQFRPSSQHQGYFRSKSQDARQQSVERRISPLEKKVDEIKLTLDEIIKKLPTKINLVQDEISEIYLMLEGYEQYMLIDCGCPRTLIGRSRLETYLKSQDFTMKNLVTKAPEVNLFKFGETVYTSKEIV